MKTPHKIGITGGIGSGKTTITKIFNSLGIPVFNSDTCGQNILLENKQVIAKIKEIFGNQIVIDNKINKEKLRHIVFNNKHQLERLNNIIHPIVNDHFNHWIKHQDSNYIIKESALLFESKTHQQLNQIILVTAPIKLRIQRVIKRDRKTKEDVLSIINNQLPYKKIQSKANYIINNNEKNLLTPQIIKIHQNLMQL